jgi:hypothetical protein
LLKRVNSKLKKVGKAMTADELAQLIKNLNDSEVFCPGEVPVKRGAFRDLVLKSAVQ